jgi:hypothetical protein
MFLGWHNSRPGAGSASYDFYIRQLRDWQASADIATMSPAAMRAYGQLCGWTLARAHARSDDRIAIAAYLAGPRSSIRRPGSSPPPTPTRTSTTTVPWRPRERPGACPVSEMCDAHP